MEQLDTANTRTGSLVAGRLKRGMPGSGSHQRLPPSPLCQPGIN